MSETASDSDDEAEGALRYDEIRTAVEDGDVLLFRGTVVTSRIIETVSSGVYSHAGLALWWGDRLMLCEAVSKGVQAVPLRAAVSTYEGAVDWYKLRPEARARLDVKLLLREAKIDLGMPYARLALIREGIQVLTGAPVAPTRQDRGELVCSEYVSRCYRKGGLPLSDRSDLDTSPTEIATSAVLELMGTLVIGLREAPPGAG